MCCLSSAACAFFDRVCPQFFMSNNSIYWAPTALGGVPTGMEMCIDVDGGKGVDGAKVVISSCTGQPQQQWVWDGQGYIRWFQNSTMCLDVHDSVRSPQSSAAFHSPSILKAKSRVI